MIVALEILPVASMTGWLQPPPVKHVNVVALVMLASVWFGASAAAAFDRATASLSAWRVGGRVQTDELNPTCPPAARTDAC